MKRSRSFKSAVFGGSRPDPLAGLGENFGNAGAATMTGRGWTIEDTSPSCSPSDLITSGEADLTISGGSASGSFWFDANDGALWYKEHSGPVDFRARVRVRNAANTGPTSLSDFEIAGIAAHDPDRSTYEFVHVALGSDGTASLREEWKTNDNNDSAYAYINATLTGGELLYDLRIVRRASDDQIFDLYTRAGTAQALASDVGWSNVVTVDRTDDTVPDRVANNGSTAVALPAALRYGFMVYSSAVVHDIRMFVSECQFRSTTA